MNNPWEEIRLDDYENHMRLDSVKQLQALNQLMRDQFAAYPVRTAMILGVAGGNGLEHISNGQFDAVYGVDINRDYLNAVTERYSYLGDMLRCLRLNLLRDADKLPQAELVVANLLIEYIGYSAFQSVIRQVEPKYVSCVIQINTEEEAWVSDSPYLHAFDRLDEVHHQMDENVLEEKMKEIGYTGILQEARELPNGKKLVRLDYMKA